MGALAARIGGSSVCDFFLQCAASAGSMWDGGNQWSGYAAYLSFFRHVAQLNLPVYKQWQHFEAAAIHGGPRLMHAEFCLISDRPCVLTVDADRRPHNETGPFCAWRDGTRLYAWHGTYVPEWLIEHPERITPQHIYQEANVEVRRVMLERYGFERFVADSGAQPISVDTYGTLYRIELPDDEPLVMVKVRNSTPEPDGSFRDYTLRVPPETQTAHAAVAWSFGLTPPEYAPSLET
jgi:hypothetical protein